MTTGEIGRYCGVHFRTVLRWIAQGRLKAFRLPGRRGDNRVLLSDFLEFLKNNNIPLPDEFQAGARRVLVVAEDRRLAGQIERVVRGAGFETEVAQDGLQAGILLQAFAPALLILGLPMTGLVGDDVLRFLRSRRELDGLRVLAVSEGQELERIRRCGADEVLSKPLTSERLLAKVSALAGRPSFGRNSQ